MIASRPLLLAFAATLVHCAALDTLPPDTCGNGVVEANEDCDTFSAFQGTACGAPDDGVRACRLTCDHLAPSSCPPGWGCSVDDFCRRASGEFEPPGDPTSAANTALRHGDFDGDGRSDLVGLGAPGRDRASRASVHFFGDGAALLSQTVLPARIAPPSVNDLDGDGLDDLTFILSGLPIGALGTFVGRADRSFVPISFPVNTRPQTDAIGTAIHVTIPGVRLPLDQASAALLLVREPTGTRLVSEGAEVVLGIEGLSLPVPIGPEQVIGLPAHGRILTGLLPGNFRSACGELVFAYNAGARGGVLVVSPCFVPDGGDQAIWSAANAVFDFPFQRRVERMILADVDRDGDDDIWVELEGAGALEPFSQVALATGTSIAPFAPVQDDDLRFVPLAVADLDGNGVGELIAPTGIARSRPSDAGADASSFEILFAASRAPWTQAIVGHFNADPFLDVVAIVAGAPDIEVLLGGGDGTFNATTIPTERPVHQLAQAGDLDRDGIDDIIFLEAKRPLDDPEGGDARVGISFGRAFGPPEPVRMLGEFMHGRSVAFLPSHGIQPGAVAVLDVTSSGGSFTSVSTTLYATGDRQILAPLFVRDNGALDFSPGARIRAWFPLAAGVGNFTGNDDVLDLAALCIGVGPNPSDPRRPIVDGPSIWLSKGSPTARGGFETLRELGRFQGVLASAIDLSSEGAMIMRAVSATGDIDAPPDGTTEIVALVRTGPARAALTVVRPNEGPSSPQLVEIAIELDQTFVSPDDQIALVDVDVDGRPDVVYLGGTSERDPFGKLRVFYNRGDGAFEPPVEIPEGADGPYSAFTHVLTGATEAGLPRRELAVASKSGIALVRPSAAGRNVFEIGPLLPVGPGPRDPITGLDAADVDGDGLEDIAIVQAGTIRIARQKEKR